jgi:3-isopropylmalate/(R)-2-methylmalate dehydratase large subunit
VPRSLFEKIWDRHVITTHRGVDCLLYVDLLLVHEGSNHAFSALEQAGRGVARPRQVIAVCDHYVPSAGRAAGIADPSLRGMVEGLEERARRYGLVLFAMQDERQGIQHVVCPEQGLSQPGILFACGDSHGSTHGAFGNLAFGIGNSEIAHVLATQRIWQRKPKTMRVTIEGRMGFGISAKDLILALIAQIGIGGAVGHVVEYAGATVRGLSMDQRMTICNMTIEAGGRAGMVAPDDTTFHYLAGRPFAPKGAAWDAALADWQSLPSDADARFDREVSLAADRVAPMVSWGTNPEHALPITGTVPDPAAASDPEKRREYADALAYMDLVPGQPLQEIAIDRVFIGSCTNSRLDDLCEAAEIAKRGKARVPAWVVPGSGPVKRQAEAEGLDQIFRAAGFEWREPGCSLCTALNGDSLRPGERCASTSNRNFQGRQGPGGRTHLMSPAMAAAAALAGRLADVREIGRGGA